MQKKKDIKKQLSIDSNARLLTHTGSLYPGRGAELFNTILEKFDQVCILHIGGSIEQIEYWKKKINHPRFYGFPHIESMELPSIQASSDFLLFPMTKKTKTYWCCSPMKLFEYMASSRPILCSNIGSIKEVVNEEMVIFFNPDDHCSLFQAVEDAITNYSSAEAKAASAFMEVKNNYTWDLRAKKIANFISEIED